MSKTSFASLSLQQALLDNLASLNYQAMTPIQAQSLPPILAGEDVIAQAKTGSGKTAAFGIGVLERLAVQTYAVQALVLCPTRELADQVAKEIRKLARTIANIKVLTLCGGMPFGPQLASLERSAHIVVGTPGRIVEHLSKGRLQLDKVTTFVLDEADRMLEMGFQEALDTVIDHLPSKRQNLLFSATYPSQIQAMAARTMVNPVVVKVESSHASDSIEQLFFRLPDDMERIMALQLLLLHYRPDSAVVFCKTKREAQEVADTLAAKGLSALALHGDLEQKIRDEMLVRFANKSASILVATDVAARGLDIDALDLVINYQMAHDNDVHIHRIGRTGRAGSHGRALTLFDAREQFKIDRLSEYLQQAIAPVALPSRGLLSQPGYKPPMVTLQIDGGKKQKLRPGDILGALTKEYGVAGGDVGKIHIFDQCAFVAIKRNEARNALSIIMSGKLKGRNFRARIVS